MKITFTLDDVIRAKTVQFGKIYKKYINPNLDLSSIDLSSGNLMESFNFKTKKEFDKFLYEDYAFEIFGEASACDKQLDKKLNLWLLNAQDDELANDLGIEFALSNPFEFNNSIGFTYFFLSKIATRIREAFFPLDSIEILKKSDIIITANNELLELAKENNCTSVKIETDYNKECVSDLTYGSLIELLEDEVFFEKIKEVNNNNK